MCYSATASYLTAAVTGAIGVATLRRARGREVPMASIPFIFAVQQAVEGSLWLTLPTVSDGAFASWLTLSFLAIALLLWPVYAPTAAFLIEPPGIRRWAIAACLMLGVATAAQFLPTIAFVPKTACIGNGHIIYETGASAPLLTGVIYLISTSVPLMMSSHRTVSWLGFIVFVGSVISYFFYWAAFSSVWCFFAAGASAVLWFHFERAHSARLAQLRTATP